MAPYIQHLFAKTTGNVLAIAQQYFIFSSQEEHVVMKSWQKFPTLKLSHGMTIWLWLNLRSVCAPRLD